MVSGFAAEAQNKDCLSVIEQRYLHNEQVCVEIGEE
jgi:hypothetical protein